MPDDVEMLAEALYDNWKARRHPDDLTPWADLDPDRQAWFRSDAEVALRVMGH